MNMNEPEVEDRREAAADDDASDVADDSSANTAGVEDSDDDDDTEVSEASGPLEVLEIQVVLQLDDSPPTFPDEAPLDFDAWFAAPHDSRIRASVQLSSDLSEAETILLNVIGAQLPTHLIDFLNIRIIEQPRTVSLDDEAQQRLSSLRARVMMVMKELSNSVESRRRYSWSRHANVELQSHPLVPYHPMLGCYFGNFACRRWPVVNLMFTWRCLCAPFLESLLSQLDANLENRLTWCYMNFVDEKVDEDTVALAGPHAPPPAGNLGLLSKMLQHRRCPDRMDWIFRDVPWSSMCGLMQEMIAVNVDANVQLNFVIKASKWSFADLCFFFKYMGPRLQSPHVEATFELTDLSWGTWNDHEIDSVVQSLKTQEFCHDIRLLPIFQEDDSMAMISCFRSILEARSPTPLLWKVQATTGRSESLLNVLSACNWCRSASLCLDYTGPGTWTAVERLLRHNDALQFLQLQLRCRETNGDRSVLSPSMFRAMGQNTDLTRFHFFSNPETSDHDEFLAWIAMCTKRNRLLLLESSVLWPRAFTSVGELDNHPSLIFDVLRRRVDGVGALVDTASMGNRQGSGVDRVRSSKRRRS